jgi:PadR family transcriptional regulator PadR
MNDKFERQMKKGVLDMLVLKLLLDRPKYGYQIIQELREVGREVFTLKDGTLYPILYRLEEEHFVESKWMEGEGKQVPRKYYGITDTGKAALENMTEVWERISDGVFQIMQEDKKGVKCHE